MINEIKDIIRESHPEIGDYQLMVIDELCNHIIESHKYTSPINYTEKCYIDGLKAAIAINEDTNYQWWKTLKDKINVHIHHIID